MAPRPGRKADYEAFRCRRWKFGLLVICSFREAGMTAHRKDLELLGLVAVGQPEAVAVADQDLLARLDVRDGEHEQVGHPVRVQSFQQRSVLVCTV